MNILRILILDGRLGIKDELSPYFSRAGFEVFEATETRTAIRLINEQPMDIVIVDLNHNDGRYHDIVTLQGCSSPPSNDLYFLMTGF